LERGKGMTVSEWAKRTIAERQLETALRLFMEGGDMFSALTLAGAAEEILGKELEAAGVPTALNLVQAGTQAMARALHGEAPSEKVVTAIANRARNAVKHMAADGPRTVFMDPREEAREMLDRAITNYFRVTADETELMGRFLRQEYGGG
jgi:hypothetical protein